MGADDDAPALKEAEHPAVGGVLLDFVNANLQALEDCLARPVSARL